MKGLHILAEFHDCGCVAELLREAGTLRELCLGICGVVGLTVVADTFYGFGSPGAPQGATGAVVLAESHLAVHTWPELGAVTLDLYVCNFSRDNRASAEAAYRLLEQAFKPARTRRQDVQRGEVEPPA